MTTRKPKYSIPRNFSLSLSQKCYNLWTLEELPTVCKMAAAREDVKILELNLILKTLGKRRKEGNIMKEHQRERFELLFLAVIGALEQEV